MNSLRLKLYALRAVAFVGIYVVTLWIVAAVSLWLDARGYWSPSVPLGLVLPALTAWYAASAIDLKAAD